MEDVIMEKMSLDKVMRKIQKLKKLYEGAKKINSEGEAQNAAALIQKLLTEYKPYNGGGWFGTREGR